MTPMKPSQRSKARPASVDGRQGGTETRRRRIELDAVLELGRVTAQAEGAQEVQVEVAVEARVWVAEGHPGSTLVK